MSDQRLIEWLSAVQRDYDATKPILEAARDANGNLPAHGEHAEAFGAGYAYGVQETRKFVIAKLCALTNDSGKQETPP